MSTFVVSKSGPLFDGRAELAAANAARDIEKTVATLGASMIRSQLQLVLRKQTPVYRLKVVAVPTNPHWKIWDQRMIYGPWLEGTGSRNKTTRFKGYRTFRITVIRIQDRANFLAPGITARWIGRM
jgi:hypothetical protein